MSNPVINVIYHHDDPDGHVAAAVAAHYILKINKNSKIKFFAKQYTDEFNNHADIEDPNIDINLYFLDLSFTDKTKDKLLNAVNMDTRVQSVLWIDHHASSKSAVEDIELGLAHIMDSKCIFDTTGSGCALTYYYFLGLSNMHDVMIGAANPAKAFEKPETTPLPEFLYHVDNYDRWTKKDPDADAFITGLKIDGYQVGTNETDFNSIYKGDILDWDSATRIANGRVALAYQKQLYLEQKDLIGIDTLGNYKYAYKVAPGNSWNFNDLIDNEEVDFGMLIRYEPKSKKWIHSIYSKVDHFNQSNKIAEIFGGGGHPGAAGFQIDYPLPMNIDKVTNDYPDFFNFVYSINN